MLICCMDIQEYSALAHEKQAHEKQMGFRETLSVKKEREVTF